MALLMPLAAQVYVLNEAGEERQTHAHAPLHSHVWRKRGDKGSLGQKSLALSPRATAGYGWQHPMCPSVSRPHPQHGGCEELSCLWLRR